MNKILQYMVVQACVFLVACGGTRVSDMDGATSPVTAGAEGSESSLVADSYIDIEGVGAGSNVLHDAGRESEAGVVSDSDAEDVLGSRVEVDSGSEVVADSEAPVVTILLPEIEAVSTQGAFFVEADAIDNVGVVSVSFELNGSRIGGAVYTSPFLLELSGDDLLVGEPNRLRVVAVDAVGNEGASEVEFSIPDLTPPVVSFVGLFDGDVLFGSRVTVEVSAEDNVGVSSVSFQLNGVGFGRELFVPPYVESLDLSNLIAASSHVLTAVVTDSSGNVSSESVSIRIGENVYSEVGGETKIFLTQERLAKALEHRDSRDEVWEYFVGLLDDYLVRRPYSSGEYAAAFALAYRLTGDLLYLNRAKELFWLTYRDWDYKSRNGFRSNNRFAHYVFDWLRDGLTQEEKAAYVSLFTTWANYWEQHVDYANDFRNFRWQDTDETTSLVENFLLMALSLEGENDVYAQTLFNISDEMFSRFVVAGFMEDLMAGGVWGEGSDYSPNTMRHWLRSLIVNRESRNISMAPASRYARDVLYALVHMTFPDGRSMFQYGDVEAARDYRLLGDDYRFELMLVLIEALDRAEDKALGRYWLNLVEEREGVPSLSGSAGMWRLLFEEVNSPAMGPESVGLDTTYVADGLQLVATRAGWGEADNVVYFQNGTPRVDHMQKDALSFNIVSGGVVITKESTGYAGPADQSIAHNSLLIENADGGSSSPTGRFAGDGALKVVASTDHYTYIEADATQLYNSSGYRADIYLDAVVRKLVFLKPDIVVVYDNIELLAGNEGRWRKYIQHFQVEPTLYGNGFYETVSEGKRFYFKTLLPTEVVTTKVDESQLWRGFREYEVPENQRKWHLSVEPAVANLGQTEFLHVLQFGDSSTLTAPAEVVALSPANDNVFSGELQGAHFKGVTDTVVLFSNGVAGELSYEIGSSGASKHLVFGLQANASYSVQASAQDGVVTVSIVPGGMYVASGDGVLEFDL